MTDDECIHLLLIGTCSICAEPKKTLKPKRLRPTTAPKSADDAIEPLAGDKDVSMPVYDLDPYHATRTDWMPAIGGYPHSLRPNGWLYLRCGDKLIGRVRVPSMAWRDERPHRTGAQEGNEGFGPGLVFRVDPDTWEPVDQSLGEDAEKMRQGYRYHLTDRQGQVHHFVADAAISEGDWAD